MINRGFACRVLPLISSVLVFAGCMSSEREEALRNEISSLRLELSGLRQTVDTRTSSVDKLKNSTDSSVRWVQETKATIEDMRQEVRVLRGSFNELNVRLERAEKGAQGGAREDSVSLVLRDEIAALNKRIAVLERGVLRATLPQEPRQSTKKGKLSLSPDSLSAKLRSDIDDKKLEAAVNLASQYLAEGDDDPKFAEVALRYRGEALFNQRRFDRAAADFLEFLDRFPKSDMRGVVLLWAGDAFVLQKRLDVAKGLYVECQEIAPPESDLRKNVDERLRRFGS